MVLQSMFAHSLCAILIERREINDDGDADRTHIQHTNKKHTHTSYKITIKTKKNENGKIIRKKRERI